MYTTLHLILAHFLADFPFQPRWLVSYKQRHIGGVLLHGMTHFVTSIVLLSPFMREKKIWIGIAIIFLAHIAFDQIKIKINQSSQANRILTYILDQLAHLTMIALVAIYYIGPLTPQFPAATSHYYTDSSLALYLLTATLFTYFYDVTRWTYLNMKKPRPYKRDYNMIFRNFLIVTFGFAVYWVTT
jgi:hypothetical protein